MTKRRLAWIAAAGLGALALLGIVWSGLGTNRIVLTDAHLQDRVNHRLPREVKGVTIEQVTITIAQGQIALRTDVRASALKEAVSAAVFARGIPHLDAERGELFFYAEDVRMENLSIGNPEGAAGQPTSRLGALLGENLTRVKERAADMIAAGVKSYLAARPVYRFKDDLKGLVLKAAITNVAIEHNAVAIELSLITLSVMVVVCLFVLLAVLVGVIQLIRHPNWGGRAPLR